MRSVILLPVMGEKLLLTIPEKYYIYLVAIRFDCTRQSSSAAISKNKKLRITLNQNLISQLYFHFSSNPHGNFNCCGGQVLIDSRKKSQIGSISYPICKFALAAWLSFVISIPSMISLFQYAFSSAIICVFLKSRVCLVL